MTKIKTVFVFTTYGVFDFQLPKYCRSPVLGLGLGVDFTFAWKNNNNNKNPHLNFSKGDKDQGVGIREDKG